MSAATITLAQQWAQLELEAVMLAEGRTSQAQAHISRQHPESRQPSAPGPPTIDIVLSIKHNHRLDPHDRYQQARELVDTEKHGPADRGEETTEQFEWRIRTQYVGVTTAEVARRELDNPMRIMRIRRGAGQDSHGNPKAL